MPKTKAAPRSDTREEILDLAQMLIQTRGYSAFSYQDIAAALGIRKASIHYHFPSKTDLGVAVVERYVDHFGKALAEVAAQTTVSSMTMFDHYVAPYLEFGATHDKVCLSCALAGEMMALPAELRARVDGFFRSHQAWLAGILKRGIERGEFSLEASPAKTARLVFGALQGALLVKRTTGDASQLRDVIAVLKAQLGRKARS